MSLGKVTLLVVGLVILGALAAPVVALTYQNSWSSPYFSSPFGSYYGSPYGSYGYPSGLGTGTDLGSIYGSTGPFGSGYGYSPYGYGYGSSPYGYGSGYGYPYGYGYGSSPYGYGSGYGSSPYGSSYSTPSSTTINSAPTTDLFSNSGASSPFAKLFGNSLLRPKTYGPPPTDAINATLIGQKLSYDSGFMGIPLQYQVENSDIGAVTGMQYQGADAWKVRVGQQGMFWDVILDSTGKKILSASQVK